jgi:HD-GYP domain-containing protein (c-di-GMP phosphodiesterase class II)
MNLAEQIRKLNAIGIALSSEHNLNNLLEMIVTEARSFTHADGGSLYIKEKDKLHFRVAQTESLQKRDGKIPFTSFYLPLSKESIAGYVAATGEVLNIPDVYEVPPTVEYRVNKHFDRQNNYRSRSMLVVPMRDHHDEIIGVLQLINSINGRGEVGPFEPEYESIILSLASQAAVAIRNVRLIGEIRDLFRSLVRYSATAIDARSPHTAGHSGRVAKHCVRLANAINEETEGRLGQICFSQDEIEELRVAGWLHDIGKIGVRESVLEKSTKLNEDQMEVIAERFEGIKFGLRTTLLERKLKQLGNAVDGVSALREVELATAKEIAAIDDALAFLRRINVPGFLTSDDQARLKTLAETSYMNSRGEPCFFLTAKEYENLAIVRGNLTDGEYREIQSHVEHTLNILKNIPFTKDLQDVTRHAAGHHEYLDGSGYPLGLKGDEISIQSRIMCIADIFDALSSPDRPYKKAIPIERTFEILREEVLAGKLDGDIVELFIRKRLYQKPAMDDGD